MHSKVFLITVYFCVITSSHQSESSAQCQSPPNFHCTVIVELYPRITIKAISPQTSNRVGQAVLVLLEVLVPKVKK